MVASRHSGDRSRGLRWWHLPKKKRPRKNAVHCSGQITSRHVIYVLVISFIFPSYRLSTSSYDLLFGRTSQSSTVLLKKRNGRRKKRQSIRKNGPRWRAGIIARGSEKKRKNKTHRFRGPESSIPRFIFPYTDDHIKPKQSEILGKRTIT